MTTENPQPFIPELPKNPDKIQKLFALRELLQKVADLKDSDNRVLFNYGDSHFRSKIMNDHPTFRLLNEQTPEILEQCGTPGCVAGWAGVLDPEHWVCDTQNWTRNKIQARQFLELTFDEAEFLFMGDAYFDADDRMLYGSVELKDATIQEAIKRLDFLIKLNE
jgi:hypothetical protein